MQPATLIRHPPPGTGVRVTIGTSVVDGVAASITREKVISVNGDENTYARSVYVDAGAVTAPAANTAVTVEESDGTSASYLVLGRYDYAGTKLCRLDLAYRYHAG